MNIDRYLLILASSGVIFALFFSWLLGKLDMVGATNDPFLASIRFLNRDIWMLALSVAMIIIVLWRQTKQK